VLRHEIERAQGRLPDPEAAPAPPPGSAAQATA
jgi:hypothetical protein